MSIHVPLLSSPCCIPLWQYLLTMSVAALAVLLDLRYPGHHRYVVPLYLSLGMGFAQLLYEFSPHRGDTRGAEATPTAEET